MRPMRQFLPLLLSGALLSSINGVSAAAGLDVGLQAGAGWLPLSDWADAWESIGSYDSDEAALYGEVFAVLQLKPRHAIRLSVERITTSASLDAATTFVPGPGGAAIAVDWDFSSIPVSLGYEFVLHEAGTGARSLVGAGAGLYFSDLDGSAESVFTTDPDQDLSDRGQRDGTGYGFHAYFRQTAPVTDRLYLTLMLRGRWADGMAFDDEAGDVAVEFTGVDVSAGVQWAF